MLIETDTNLSSGARSRENGRGDTYSQQQNTLLLNEGRHGIEFPAWLRLSAQRAYETLLPWGKTIEDALHFYVSHLENAKKAAPLRSAIDELINKTVWFCPWAAWSLFFLDMLRPA